MDQVMDLTVAVAKIEELSRSNTDLLGKIKERNEESKAHREAAKAFHEATGIDVRKYTETLGKMKTGELILDDLTSDQKADFERTRPILREADSILGKILVKAGTPNPKENTIKTPSTEPSGNDELEKLKAELSAAKRTNLFLAEGAKGDYVPDLIKLFVEPQIAEGQDAQTVMQEAMTVFKARYPWGFGQDAQTPQATPQIKPPVIPPHQGAVAGNANAKASIELQVAEAEKRGDVMELIRLGREQKAIGV